jgi:hypothetical protein
MKMPMCPGTSEPLEGSKCLVFLGNQNIGEMKGDIMFLES